MTGESIGWLGVPLAIAAGAIRGSAPFLFVSLGECLTEKSGKINLGLEGTLLLGAMSAYAIAYKTGSPWLGVVGAGMAGMVLGLIHAWLAQRPRVNDIAVGIAISTLGFLSQGMLTAPRVYHAMARDGLFFESVGRLSSRTGAPVTAIVLQGIAATAIAFSGKYEQILNYEVSVDFIAFSLAAGALFLFRREGRAPAGGKIYRAPGHPYTTALFVAACVAIVASTVFTDPLNSARGWGIMLTGLPVYWLWRRNAKKTI